MIRISSIRCLLQATAVVLVSHAPIAAQDAGSSLPVFSAADLRLDAERLSPHRLLYDPLDGEQGFASGMFSDSLYRSPQVSLTMDRTVYYDATNKARDAIRVRWVSNTHPHTDEILVDARTLATVNERTKAGRNWDTRDEVIYVREGTARVVSVSDEDDPSVNVYDLRHSDYYGLMVFPYLFASMDVSAGTRFRLATVGTTGEGYVEIEVFGESTFLDHAGEQRSAQLVTSRHGWGEIDWYVGKEAPYHLHAVWRIIDEGKVVMSSVSKVINWVSFPADVSEDVVNHEVLRRIIPR